jgi:hypothetical protein
MWSGILVMLVLGTTQPLQEPQALRQGGTRRTLVVTYSDGQTASRLLDVRGRSIKPNFPQRPDAPTLDGLSLSGLQLDHVVDRDVAVTVSLRYGAVYQKTVEVTTVRLTGAEPVTVKALEAYGVDAIVLSLGDFTIAPLVNPTASSVSQLLDVSVELTQHELPHYKVTVRNRSVKPVMAFVYRTFLGETAKITGRKKTHDYTPIIAGDGEIVFTTQAGSGGRPGIDRLEIDAVLWRDGVVEGDGWLKDSEEAHALGAAQQLGRVLRLLEEAASDEASGRANALSEIRTAVDALPIAFTSVKPEAVAAIGRERRQWVESGQQGIKVAVQKDLDDAARAHANNREASRAWITATRDKYQTRLRRLETVWRGSMRLREP